MAVWLYRNYAYSIIMEVFNVVGFLTFDQYKVLYDNIIIINNNYDACVDEIRVVVGSLKITRFLNKPISYLSKSFAANITTVYG